MIVNFYNSPDLLWRITVRFWRKRKRDGRITMDKDFEVLCQSPAEAEATVTTKLLKSKRTLKKYQRFKVLSRAIVPDPLHPGKLTAGPEDEPVTREWLEQEFATL